MRFLLIVLFLGLGMANSNAQSDTTCPVAVFVPLKLSDWCPTGNLTLAWLFCNEDYDGNGSPDNYWTADSVQWNMGDGTLLTTLGTSNVNHTYGVVGTVQITAVGYFTGQLSEHCIVPFYTIYDAYGSNGDPCVLANDTTSSITYDPYLEMDPYVANPAVYFSTSDACAGESITIYDAGIISPTPASYTYWNYELLIDGVSVATGTVPSSSGTALHTDTFDEGDYMVELIYEYYVDVDNDSCSTSNSFLLTVEDCDTCTNCNSFRPIVGERYWLSAWVKEDHSTPVKRYENSLIRMLFTGGSGEAQFLPTGDLVEGWQRIVGSFTIPSGTTDLDIQLINTDGTIDTYFDDIRIHPFNASMKSYVYDPETLWLTAELDDNNYATFYEYDQQGELVRIKKETARGIMTIQESRSSNPKGN